MAYNYMQGYQPNMYAQQSQIQRLQKMRDEITEQLTQIQQQPAPQIQQTFITPQANVGQNTIPAQWVNNYEEAKGANVYVATIFMDKNSPKFYIKDENGNIKSFMFQEIEELDEKDIKIRELENKIKELEGGNANGKSVNEPNGKYATTNEQSVTTNANEPTA